MTEARRLIEVDLPIKVLSDLGGRPTRAGDVDVRRVGPWWSRKPQHQCRAIWFATVMVDPTDPAVPDAAVAAIRKLMATVSLLPRSGSATRPGLLKALTTLVARLAEPESALNAELMGLARELVQLVCGQDIVALDPFAGGGSVPVEAKRLGLNVVAGEYNGLAATYLRVLLEHPQRLRDGWQQQVQAAASLLGGARVPLAELYPKHPTLGQPFGYIRFRQLRCEGPSCGSLVPATSKFELDRAGHTGVVYAPSDNGPSFRVRSKQARFAAGTMRAGSLTCPIPSCGFTTRRSAVMKQHEAHGARSRIVAVAYHVERDVVLADPTEEQLVADDVADHLLSASRESLPKGEWPLTELRRFSPQLYGYRRFSDCHTPRQALYLNALAGALAGVPRDGARDDLAAAVLAQTVVEHTAFCRWRADNVRHETTFAGKSLGMMWDHFEADPFHDQHAVERTVNTVGEVWRAAVQHLIGDGTVLEGPTQELPLLPDMVDFVYTDPPYYDAIPYSHLSDWPLVWIRHALGAAGGDGLADKRREIVVDRKHRRSPSIHDPEYFRFELGKALSVVRSVMKPSGVGVIVFAHSSTEAWEALLERLLAAGFVVTASWPVVTERQGRLQAQQSANLQSSVHLVVRPREHRDGSVDSTTVGDWRDVVTELPRRIHEWMPRLVAAGVVGADAIFACLGPALEVFSRYARVEDTDGQTIELVRYLEKVWEAVAKEALDQIFEGGDATGFEEDARLTAMWLWTLSAARRDEQDGQDDDTGDDVDDDDDDDSASGVKKRRLGLPLEYDAARKIAQGLGAHLDALTSLVEVTGKTAWLLPVEDRAAALFGRTETPAGAAPLRKGAANPQMKLGFVKAIEQAESERSWGELGAPAAGRTTLDRVHQAMLLFGANRGEALRRFLVEDGAGKNDRFWRLAQALNQLYPPKTDERRWVEGVLARKKMLGF